MTKRGQPYHKFRVPQPAPRARQLPPRPSTAAHVLAIVRPVLEEHGISLDRWLSDHDTRTRDPSITKVKRILALLLKGKAWSTASIARALGVDSRAVRGYINGKPRKPVAELDDGAAVAEPKRLPVVQGNAGSCMRAEPGPRYDCVYDPMCLGALLAMYPRSEPPLEASCTPDCKHRTAPNHAKAQEDATRGPGWW